MTINSFKFEIDNTPNNQSLKHSLLNENILLVEEVQRLFKYVNIVL